MKLFPLSIYPWSSPDRWVAIKDERHRRAMRALEIKKAGIAPGLVLVCCGVEERGRNDE